MQDRVTYEFAIIRVVPKVEREEFINVGVLVFSKRKKYLGIKYTINNERLRALSKTCDINIIEEYLLAWESICQGAPNSDPIGEFELADRFRWLAAAKSTMLQCSPIHPGLCTHPEKELEDLFNRYVL
jgi:Protein of unknown function (DUF3037)